MEPPTEFLKLSASQLRAKMHVKNEYHDFFNNIAFKKGKLDKISSMIFLINTFFMTCSLGWAKPRFTHDEVDELFDLASEIVVRLRTDVDKANPRWKLRLTIGGAKEYLWQVEKIEDRDKFVRGNIYCIFHSYSLC